jgi:multiple sugar transport system substrate-binding protein
MNRRSTAIAAAGLLGACALVISGCAADPGSGTDGDPVELRFAWWGGDKRAELTQQVIDLFEKKHTNITITGEFADFGTYWPRLAISVAGGDAPDIMQFEEQFLREYSSRGALADLGELDIDTSAYADAILQTGTTAEGLVSLSAGVITPAIVANPKLFEAAGIDIPDDATWTWDDYAEASRLISESDPGSVWGSEQLMFETSLLNVYTRQNGEATYTEDGKMGISEDLLTELWEMVLANQKSGATTPADLSVEEITKPLEQSGPATGTLGMGEWYSHNLGVLEGAAGQELTLLRMPGAALAAGSEYLKSSMSWSISAKSAHPEEAALFVDFISNDPEAQKILGTERGMPANEKAREVIQDTLSDADLQGLDMIEKITAVASDPPILPPAGSGALQAIMQRYTTEVLFERMTPRDAAKQFLAEANDTLDG